MVIPMEENNKKLNLKKYVKCPAKNSELSPIKICILCKYNEEILPDFIICRFK